MDESEEGGDGASLEADGGGPPLERMLEEPSTPPDLDRFDEEMRGSCFTSDEIAAWPETRLKVRPRRGEAKGFL